MIVPDEVSIPITDRASWLEMRRQDVTASDIAAVCGVHPQRSALQVWADKFNPQGDQDNKMMRRGRWLEPAVLEAVRDQRPEWKVESCGLYMRSPSLRIGATPDGFVRSLSSIHVLQAKVVSRSAFENWHGEVPLYYQLQVLTEMALMNLPTTGYLAALVIGEFSAELELFPVEWQPAAWDRVQRDVGAWWSDVMAGRKPRADYTKDGDALKKMHEADGRDVKQRVDLSDDNRLAVLCQEYAGLGKLIKTMQEDRDATAAEIIDKLAGTGKAKCGDFNLSYVGINVPEKVVDAYSFNRLTITQPKGK